MRGMFSRRKKAPPDLAPPPKDMFFVTLSHPPKPSSFKYRTALSEQWKKIGPVQGTIDFLLTNDYNFSTNNPEVMSWNILGPEAAADGFATSLGREYNKKLEKVTTDFKNALGEVDDADERELKTNQKYAIYAHYIVLGVKWRHYVNGTFAVDENKDGPQVQGGLRLNLSPQEYSARLEWLKEPELLEEEAMKKRTKIREWINDKRGVRFMGTENEKTLAKKAAALMLGWAGVGEVPAVEVLALSKGGREIKKVYNKLAVATENLQLGKLEEERWPRMKTYMGMGPPAKKQGSVAPPKCNVWCLQEMDKSCLKYLKKEHGGENSIDYYGFGGGPYGDSKDCVVAWDENVWQRPPPPNENLRKWEALLNAPRDKDNKSPSAAVVLKNIESGDTCIFVSVHLKSGTGISLDQRTDELSHLAAILVSMIDEDKGTPSIVIGMDANDPRGDILLRMAIQTAKETVAELKHEWATGGGALSLVWIAEEVNKKLRVLCATYDGGKSTESGAFGDGLQEYTPWLPNFNPRFGDVVPSDHRYVMADPSRKFLLQDARPLGNFDSVKNPNDDFVYAGLKEKASEEETKARAPAPAPAPAARAQARAPAPAPAPAPRAQARVWVE